ncbi:MAG: methyltransferase [Candidatus ainarchaeum sp.]|nr:methyltransferase [Candidatus ainarchaeum sp.]
MVDEVYSPEEDSYLIEKCILEENLTNKKCLDMGTGSGIQSKAMYKAGARNIFAIDINYKALFASQKNNHEITQSIRFVESDLFSKISNEKFDFIAFNPPYVPSGKIKWKDLDGGKKGRETIDKFLNQLPNHIVNGSILLLLVSSLNNPDEIIDILENQGFITKIINSKKFFFEEIFVIRAIYIK